MKFSLIFRYQQACQEIRGLKQTIAQKDKEIQQVTQREQSAQDELKVRAERIKAHEKTVTELREKNDDYQKQLKEFESKCERLEGEVNRVNAQRLGGKISRERTADEVSHELMYTVMYNCLMVKPDIEFGN